MNNPSADSTVSPRPSSEQDLSAALCEQVQSAYARQTPLAVQGGNTRAFLANHRNQDVTPEHRPLALTGHTGVVSYEPTELVLTARTGTLLTEIEQVLAKAGQMLPFEPPRFGDGSTLGGVVASGLSGPRRPYSGSVRDFVLGVNCINGQGQALVFGGQVMKNVAGYDLSRLMTGAFGTLGVLTQVSLKVLPKPELEQTQILQLTADDALEYCHKLAQSPLPVSGAAHDDGVLRIRLSGSEGGVHHAASIVGGDTDESGSLWWEQLRDWQLPVMTGSSLWRLSVPGGTGNLDALPGSTVIDWGGAQRWFVPGDDMDTHHIHNAVTEMGGHAWQIRGESDVVFSQPPAALTAIHQRLKDAFDPARLFNPNRYIIGL